MRWWSILRLALERGFVLQAVVAGEPLDQRVAHPFLQECGSGYRKWAAMVRVAAARHRRAAMGIGA
jgi:hypothetical protein